MDYAKLFAEWYQLLKKRAVDWNIRKLPDNTEEMQMRKVIEEVIESLDAPNDVNEKADVIISIWGIERFDKKKGIVLAQAFWKLNTNVREILIAADDKLDVLEAREYHIKNGVYHH